VITIVVLDALVTWAFAASSRPAGTGTSRSGQCDANTDRPRVTAIGSDTCYYVFGLLDEAAPHHLNGNNGPSDQPRICLRAVEVGSWGTGSFQTDLIGAV